MTGPERRAGDPACRLVLSVDGPVCLGTLDALARLRLAARRAGIDVRVATDRADVRDLLRLTGLDRVLAARVSVIEPPPLAQRQPVAEVPSIPQVGWQAEAGEQPGVEEVVDVGDPPG